MKLFMFRTANIPACVFLNAEQYMILCNPVNFCIILELANATFMVVRCHLQSSLYLLQFYS